MGCCSRCASIEFTYVSSAPFWRREAVGGFAVSVRFGGRSHAQKATAAVAWMVAMALSCVVTATVAGAAVAGRTLAKMMQNLFGGNAASVQDDGHVVKIEWQCPGGDEEDVFCIEGSMISYMTVMEAVRDQKLDVTGGP